MAIHSSSMRRALGMFLWPVAILVVYQGHRAFQVVDWDSTGVSRGTEQHLDHLAWIEPHNQTTALSSPLKALPTGNESSAENATTMLKQQDVAAMTNHSSANQTQQSSNTSDTAKTLSLTPTKVASSSFVVDIMSIGSMARQDLQQAQRTTFASHRSVRHFFNITEADDADPLCSVQLTTDDVLAISDFCHTKRKWTRRQWLMRYLKHPYARKRWLRRKQNPAGWMCAQKRPAHGLYQVLQFYKQHTLPDYLIVMDDDTYYNLHLFQQHMQSQNSSIPYAMAGCLVRSPVRQINYTIPFGGFGLTLSKGALENWLRPIHCKVGATTPPRTPFQNSVCTRKEENHIDERQFFREGMSVSDLLQAYVSYEPYVRHANWTTGFCLHSDWIWGFFVNFYNISNHVQDPLYADVPHARMEAYLGSEINAAKIDDKDSQKLCLNEKENCGPNSEICHYQTAQNMTFLTNQVRQLVPQEFVS